MTTPNPMLTNRVQCNPGAMIRLAYDEESAAFIKNAFRELGAKVSNALAAEALKDSWGPMMEAAKAKVPVRYGDLRESIGVRLRKYARAVYASLGPQKGRKRTIITQHDDGHMTRENVDPSNYAHLVEFGTRPHYIAPKGRGGALRIKRGKGPTVMVEGAVAHYGAEPKPFLRPAFESHAAGLIETYRSKIMQAIENAVTEMRG